jgi:hypothetical protein
MDGHSTKSVQFNSLISKALSDIAFAKGETHLSVIRRCVSRLDVVGLHTAAE